MQFSVLRAIKSHSDLHTLTHTHTAPEVLIIQGWPLDNPVLRLSWDDIKQPVPFWTWCVLQREFGRIKKRKKPLHWLCEMWASLGFHKTDLPVSWRQDCILKSLWSAVKSSLILWAQPILYVPKLKGSSKAVSWFNIDVYLILKKISWQAVICASLWWDQMETDMSLDSVQECFINSNAVSFSSAYMCQQLSFQSSIITHLVRLLWSMTSLVGSWFRLCEPMLMLQCTSWCRLWRPGGYRRRSSSWGHRLFRPSRTLFPSSAVQPAPLSSALDPCHQESPRRATM